MKNRSSESRTMQEHSPQSRLAAYSSVFLLLCAGRLAASGPTPTQMRIEVHGQAPETPRRQLSGVIQAPLQRVILDPCLGKRWQLIADAQHPERPGRLVLAESGALRPFQSRSSESAPSPAISPPQLSVIHVGDRITVSQQTPVLRARFRAVALESAGSGETLRVRILGGGESFPGNRGAVVAARAIQAGEAEWLQDNRNPQ